MFSALGIGEGSLLGVRAGAEVSASPRLDFLVSLIYENGNKKRYQKITRQTRHRDRHSDRNKVAGRYRPACGRMAPATSRSARPPRSDPPPSRARAEGETIGISPWRTS